MEIQETIVNKVANSGLITIDLADFYKSGDRVIYDISENLFHGLILKEKDFRDFVKTHDWTQYQNKFVSIICSTDAIIPTWAYMLLASRMQAYAEEVVFGDLQVLETVLFNQALSAHDMESYRDQRVIVKGCGSIPVPESAYVKLTLELTKIAKSVMYGEACSTVPVYKRKS